MTWTQINRSVEWFVRCSLHLREPRPTPAKCLLVSNWARDDWDGVCGGWGGGEGGGGGGGAGRGWWGGGVGVGVMRCKTGDKSLHLWRQRTLVSRFGPATRREAGKQQALGSILVRLSSLSSERL